MKTNLKPNTLNRLRSSSASGTLLIHDIENTFGYKMLDKTNPDLLGHLLESLDSTLGIGEEDLSIMSGNKHLLTKATEVYYEDSLSEDIIIPAGGKDGADHKLLSSLRELYSAGLIKNFNKVIIISGDSIFSNWSNVLKRNGVMVETYSIKNNTCKEFRMSTTHQYIDEILIEAEADFHICPSVDYVLETDIQEFVTLDQEKDDKSKVRFFPQLIQRTKEFIYRQIDKLNK